MADKKLAFNITADDDASKVFQKLSANAKRELGKVDDSLDDTRTAGKKAADALIALFDQLDTELGETKAAADALATALGPDLAAKVDTTTLVSEFGKLGLSVEDVKADADALADAIKKADDVTLKNFTGEADRARGAIGTDPGGLTDSARGANSALANMVGNTAQDLGAVSGLAGSAGVAIGQMAEYASDATLGGERLGSALGSMAKVAGPIALVGVAVQQLSSFIGGINAEKAFRADLVKKFSEALQDGKTVAEEMRNTLAETGELLFETGGGGGGGILGLGSKTRDLIPIFRDLGIETSTWLDFLDDPRGAADAFIAKGPRGYNLRG